MKKIIAILLLLACCARSQVVTVTLTVTNYTTNGDSLTINGITRNFVTNVVSYATNILDSTNIQAATSNIFAAYAISPQPQTFISLPATNQIFFQSYPGFPMVVSMAGPAYGTLSSSTSATTNSVYVRAAFSAAGTWEKTNVENALDSYLSDTNGTNSVQAASPQMQQFGALTNTNKWTAPQTFTSAQSQYINGLISNAIMTNMQAISGYVAGFTNGGWLNPTFTNAINTGNPFSSPGGGGSSEQYGVNANALGFASISIGDGSSATNTASLAIGFQAVAGGSDDASIGAGSLSEGIGSIAFGNGATATNTDAMAFGVSSSAIANGAIALGATSTASNVDSTAIGFAAKTTKTHQVMVGTSSEFVEMPGNLQIDGILTNALTIGGTLTTGGTNNIFGLLCYQPTTSGSLTSGGNQDVPTGTNAYVYLSGPTGAYAIYGLAGGYPNRAVTAVNTSGQVATLWHMTGNESTATNRIFLGAGHSVNDTLTFTNMASFWYDGTSNYWRLQWLQ